MIKDDVAPDWPKDQAGQPVFAAPWQAQAFAMVINLHQRGAFTWGEWAATLTEAIKAAQAQGDPDLGTTYYEHWLCALEMIVARKGLADPQALDRHRDAWQRAAKRTPHGAPIVLSDQDFA